MTKRKCTSCKRAKYYTFDDFQALICSRVGFNAPRLCAEERSEYAHKLDGCGPEGVFYEEVD